jgi:hypothetical protein
MLQIGSVGASSRQCGLNKFMQPDPSIHNTALRFANALVAGDFAAAHDMLTKVHQLEISADDIRQHYQSMISYTEDPPDTIKAGLLLPPSETDGIPDGLGWAFVDIDSLNSPNGSWLECVGLLITEEDSRHAIRQIVWGRP